MVYSSKWQRGNHMSADVLSKGKITELRYEQVLMLDGNEH